MKDILSRFLNKIGVSNYEELTSDEKATYKEWELSLQGRRLTDDDVMIFLTAEYDKAIDRITEVDLKKEDEIFRKVEVRFIKNVINFLNMPIMEKRLLEKQIESKL